MIGLEAIGTSCRNLLSKTKVTRYAGQRWISPISNSRCNQGGMQGQGEETLAAISAPSHDSRRRIWRIYGEDGTVEAGRGCIIYGFFHLWVQRREAHQEDGQWLLVRLFQVRDLQQAAIILPELRVNQSPWLGLLRFVRVHPVWSINYLRIIDEIRTARRRPLKLIAGVWRYVYGLCNWIHSFIYSLHQIRKRMITNFKQ